MGNGDGTYPVAWEGPPLDDYLVALLGGAVEARHHQVEVGCEGVHDGDFAGRGGADDVDRLARAVLGHVLPADERGVIERGEVAVDADSRPGVEVRIEVLPHCLWLRAERVSDEIDGGLVFGGVGPYLVSTWGSGGICAVQGLAYCWGRHWAQA